MGRKQTEIKIRYKKRERNSTFKTLELVNKPEQCYQMGKVTPWTHGLPDGTLEDKKRNIWSLETLSAVDLDISKGKIVD